MAVEIPGNSLAEHCMGNMSAGAPSAIFFRVPRVISNHSERPWDFSLRWE